MRISLFALALALGAPAIAADPPSKRGGLFSFRQSPRDQISAGLFPNHSAPEEQAQATTPPTPSSPRKVGGIFRGDAPEKVEPVSYVIENGQRIEKPINASLLPKKKSKPEETAPLSAPAAPTPPADIPAEALNTPEKKRGSWFGLGKRDQEKFESHPQVTPLPETPQAVPATVAPQATSPVVGAASPEAMADAMAPLKEPKEKGAPSWIPFINRKKSEAAAPAAPEAPLIAQELPVASPTTSPTAPAKPAKPAQPAKPAKPAPAPEVASASPAEPQPKPANTAEGVYEIRRDEDQAARKPEKTDREGGILTPITKIRPPRKPVDLTGAETIIENGEIVGESEPNFPTLSSESSSGPRQAPQVINGVKTYSSWKDVGASSSSAADRIINRIR